MRRSPPVCNITLVRPASERPTCENPSQPESPIAVVLRSNRSAPYSERGWFTCSSSHRKENALLLVSNPAYCLCRRPRSDAATRRRSRLLRSAITIRTATTWATKLDARYVARPTPMIGWASRSTWKSRSIATNNRHRCYLEPWIGIFGPLFT